MNKMFIPLIFIILYGSGFVFTKLGLENSSPMLFLALRFFIAFVILLFLSFILKSSWPKNKKEFLNIIVAGSLTVGVFSIGVYLSLYNNIQVSLSALIISLQPILVTLISAKVLKEKINLNVWKGLVIAFFGVFLILVFKLTSSSTTFIAIIWSFVGLFGLSIGNVYQKKYCSNMNLFTGGSIGTFSSFILVLPFLYYENIHITFNADFYIALFYMSIGVSIGALSLLYIMIKKSSISKVASIFYLVPVSTVIISYFILDSNIDISVIAGIILVLFGIKQIHKKDNL
ncbi:MAG: DMT family transporter [Campylobacteraceae bacterium]|nr:DMT family transporter [Campylobacteraceae bacterium]